MLLFQHILITNNKFILKYLFFFFLSLTPMTWPDLEGSEFTIDINVYKGNKTISIKVTSTRTSDLPRD